MTYIYNAKDNSLVQKATMEKPEIHYSECDYGSATYNHCWHRWQEYNAHSASLKRYPCDPSCIGVLEDGREYEENVHFKLGLQNCAEHYTLVQSHNCPDCKVVAFPLQPPVSEDELYTKFCNELFGNFVSFAEESIDYGGAVEHLKKHWILKRK